MWQSITDDREKYAAYLCSREWSIKKEKVAKRNGGYCERCNREPIQATHHLTYLRKYNEDLADLQGVCFECHSFIHGKVSAVVRNTGLKVYLAGKVEKNCWRHSIVKGLRSHCASGDSAPFWNLPRSLVMKNKYEVSFQFDYVGPFFVSCDHGGQHGASLHGFGDEYDETRCCEGPIIPDDYDMGHGAFDTQEYVKDSCCESIRNCDLFLAWLNDSTAYGTLVEIGYAVGCGKNVIVGCDKSVDTNDQWFARRIATQQHWESDTAQQFVEYVLLKNTRMS